MENWDDLKYVLAIHRGGSLSAAARSLGVNHATVSRRIANLEDRMGVRLFERFSDGLKVTEHGERAVDVATEVERLMIGLDVSITAKDAELAGPLKISAPQLIVQLELADILTAFKQAYPQIELSIIATSDMVNLHRREADISLRAILEPEHTLWGRRVVQQNCTYYASRTYWDQYRSDHPLACINFVWRGDKPAEEVLKVYPRAHVIAKFDDMVAVCGAVQAGLGIARMPCFIGDRNPDFVRVSGLVLEPYHDLWLLTHPDLKKVPRIRTFMDFTAKWLQRRRNVFLGGGA